jgi:hypothetical protein
MIIRNALESRQPDIQVAKMVVIALKSGGVTGNGSDGIVDGSGGTRIEAHVHPETAEYGYDD